MAHPPYGGQGLTDHTATVVRRHLERKEERQMRQIRQVRAGKTAVSRLIWSLVGMLEDENTTKQQILNFIFHWMLYNCE
jgi:hypothetical protein